MTAALAMLVDAYRELNSKKLFWVVLALSGVVVLFYGSIGFDETGMFTMFGLTHVENEFLAEGSPLTGVLYRSIFTEFMLGIWLTWAATLLALVSTTTVFPDFMASGAIDLVLAKPISRLRLFALKYAFSLLFVLVQVTVFAAGVMVCMGLRLDDWDFRVLLAIPIVLAFYSFLFCVNVLVGVLTRSPLAALLATLLFWFTLFGLNTAEGILNQVRTTLDVALEDRRAEVESVNVRIERARADGREVAAMETMRDEMADPLAKDEARVESIHVWHGRVRAVQTVLPKTSETIGLLDRWLRRDTDINLFDIMKGDFEREDDGTIRPRRDREGQVTSRLDEDYRSRSLWWILGTSFAFETVVLGIAALAFVRRDY